ncbi:CDP-glycerol glycerophosphotransferase family protein [Mesobacillus thioparans]|uniref:CDP-glycerol glycerophosphotransferase family protein n=1 Tax=Mesobacillus thioparans TaxID=370439 RepID=UPI0039F0AFC0
MFFNLMPLKDKTTFVVTFGDNSKYVFEEMRRQNIQDDVVFLCKGKGLSYFKDHEYIVPVPFESFNVVNWLKSVYHLATSKKIFVDNYFGFLAVTNFREEVECIQLWHATGAVKKFGLEDRSITGRSHRALKRFKAVYKKFDKVVVGSDVMANIFMKAFNVKNENILKTGIPRTDFFFNEDARKKVISKLKLENKQFADNKIILYAPTYRDNELDEFRLKLDIGKMKQELGEDYVLILRLHPAIKKSVDYSELYPGFVFDYSGSDYDINDLLVIADYLITDYSSIPYEFSLLGKPMLFFTYDLEKYSRERGIIEGSFPGPVVKETDTIIELILQNQFDLKIVEDFSKKWNKYSNGASSRNLVNYMFEEDFKEVKHQQAL